MDVLDGSYTALAALAGAVGRSVRRGLPRAWRRRLEARPPEGLEPGWIWLHAVSVGEILVAEGIAARLGKAGYRVHATTGTPAGEELLSRKLQAWNRAGGNFSGGMLPFDDPAGLAPFFRIPPGAFLALETEIWPGLLRALAAGAIPAVIVNGRLTERSLGRGGPWMRRAASRLALVAARDPESLDAFRRFGAPRVELAGNLKTDLPPPPALHPGWSCLAAGWAADPVVVAGNTVEGEEALLLAAWSAARKVAPGLRLVLAPRQPRRFQEVAELLARAGHTFRRASREWPGSAGDWADVPILLLDTLGELAAVYSLGTLALVGGGWTWSGGHNPLEPVRWGVPTWLGPGYSNFTDLVEPLRATGLVRVIAKNDIEINLSQFLPSLPRRGPGYGGCDDRLPPGWSGALEKTWSLLQEFLPPPR